MTEPAAKQAGRDQGQQQVGCDGAEPEPERPVAWTVKGRIASRRRMGAYPSRMIEHHVHDDERDRKEGDVPVQRRR